MKRTICAAVLLASLAGTNAFAGGWLKSVAAAQKAATDKKAYIFVDLWADWCGWCHRFEQEVAPSEAFQKATDNMVLLRLNTEDASEGAQFAQRYQATRLPMFLMLNPDLTIVGVIRGYAPAGDFANMINQTVQSYGQFKDLLKREPSLQGDYGKRFEIAQQFHTRQDYAQSETRLKKLTSEKGVPAKVRDDSYFELAMVYTDQGKLTDAMNVVNSFKKVQTQGEPFEKANFLVTELYIRQGNWAAAASELKRFKTQFPKSQLIPMADSILPQIEAQIPH